MEKLFLAIIGSYLLGSIPFGLVVGKFLKGVDVRKYGSGNIGATNVFRTLGPLPALLVAIGDVSKGIAAVGLGSLAGGVPVKAASALAAVIGGNWSVFSGFGGGKGVAVSTGVVVALMPKVVLILFLIGAAIIAATRYVSLGSITLAVILPFLVAFMGEPREYLVLSACISAFVIFKHRSNIGRLLAGKEFKLGQRVR